MMASTIHKAIRTIFIVLLYSFFLKTVESLNIVSPTEGTFVFGTLIPVNVVNSDTDTATTYTATFVCSAGTYQVTGLALGANYTLIPAGLHGLTNLIVTAAGGTTAVATIQITGPVPPTPCPTPIYAPTACLPYNNCPYPRQDEFECPRPCYQTPNKPCDRQSYRRKSHPNRCSRNENKHVDPFYENKNVPSERQTNRQSSYPNRWSRNENKHGDPFYENTNVPSERKTNRQSSYPNRCTRFEDEQCEPRYPASNAPSGRQTNRRRSYSKNYSRNDNNQSEDTDNYEYSSYPRDRARFSHYYPYEQIKPIPSTFNSPFEDDSWD